MYQYRRPSLVTCSDQLDTSFDGSIDLSCDDDDDDVIAADDDVIAAAADDDDDVVDVVLVIGIMGGIIGGIDIIGGI